MPFGIISHTYRKWMKAALGETHLHFANFLPDHIGVFSALLLKTFFSRIRLDDEQITKLAKLPPSAILVFVNKYRSGFEFLFSYTRFKQKHLPYPQVGLNQRTFAWQPVVRLVRILFAQIDSLLCNRKVLTPHNSNYFETALKAGRVGFISLVDKRAFYRRFIKAKPDPIEQLIHLQQTTERPIYLVPQLMFFGRTPHRALPSIADVLFGPEQKPGSLRRVVTLFRKPEKVFVELSEPLSLYQFIRLPENQHRTAYYMALLVRRDLLSQVNRHRQSITGPVKKSRLEIKQAILTGESLQGFMDQYAESREAPILKVHKEAADYVDEIAANYSPGLINIYSPIVGQLINIMFEDVVVDQEMLNRVKNMSTKGPVIFIPCHKSHIDYLILSYLLYQNDMPCPHVAAGKNLSFWPLGPFFRSGGAFFLRRTFRGAPLYSKVFNAYLYKLLADGFNIEFFIEGGRSRTGKLITPKLGMLSMLLDAYKKGACEDLIFAPVNIGYDRVLEERAYVGELEGGKKEPENLSQVIRARKFLKKKYGKIYIKFDDPISLKELLVARGETLQEMTPKDFNTFCRQLGYRIINAIDHVGVATPHALVASAMLNCSKGRFGYDHLVDHIETYLSLLNAQQNTLADTLTVNPMKAVDQVLEDYLQRKHIEILEDNSESTPSPHAYRIKTQRRPLLDYYKNNAIGFFIPAAYTSLAILALDAFQFSARDVHGEYRRLQEFFKFEFTPKVNRSPEYLVRKTIKLFIDQAVLMPHSSLPDTYNLTSSGFRKLKSFAAFLKPYFESCWVVLNYLAQTPRGDHRRGEQLKKIMAKGNKMYKRREISRLEAVSKISFQNALELFTSRGIKGAEADKMIEAEQKAIQTYLSMLPR